MQRSEKWLAAMIKVEAIVAAPVRGMGYVAGAVMAVLTMLLVVSSVKRYLFDKPISSTEELGSLLFLAFCLLSIPYGFARGRHVRIDMFWKYFPERVRVGLEAAGLLLGAFVLAILVRQTWDYTMFSYKIGARSDMSEINLWPWRLMFPVSFSIFALTMTLRAIVLMFRIGCNQFAETRPVELEIPLH